MQQPPGPVRAGPYAGYGPPPGPYAPPVAYVDPTQVSSQDVSQLRTLGICTIVYGCFVAFVSLFGLIYVVIGIAAAAAPPTPGDPSPVVFGATFAAIGAFITLFFAAKSALLLASGYGILNRKWSTVSYVAAGLSCLNFPLGTILGVFTFVVLGRPSVRALYASA